MTDSELLDKIEEAVSRYENNPNEGPNAQGLPHITTAFHEKLRGLLNLRTKEANPRVAAYAEMAHLLEERMKNIEMPPGEYHKGFNDALYLLQDRGNIVRGRFHRLRITWEHETAVESNPIRIVGHSAYQEIIKLGWDVVPLIIRENANRPNHWHTALNKITGQDPVRDEHAGNLVAIAQDWIVWADDVGKPNGALKWRENE